MSKQIFSGANSEKIQTKMHIKTNALVEESGGILEVDAEVSTFKSILERVEEIISSITSKNVKYAVEVTDGQLIVSDDSIPEKPLVFKAEFNPSTNTTNFSCTYAKKHEDLLVKMIGSLNNPHVKKCPNIEFALALLKEMNSNSKPIRFDDAIIEKFRNDPKIKQFEAALAENGSFSPKRRRNSSRM